MTKFPILAILPITNGLASSARIASFLPMTFRSCANVLLILTSPISLLWKEGLVVGTPASVGVLEVGLNGGAGGFGPMPRTELGDCRFSSV